MIPVIIGNDVRAEQRGYLAFSVRDIDYVTGKAYPTFIR